MKTEKPKATFTPTSTQKAKPYALSNSKAPRLHKSRKGGARTEDQLTLAKANFNAANLPFFYAKDRSTPEASFAFCRDVLPKVLKKEQEGSANSVPSRNDRQKIDFFVSLPENEQPTSLGTAQQLAKKHLFENFFFTDALTRSKDKPDLGAQDLVEMAALFHSGTGVKRDTSYAAQLLAKIDNKGERTDALAAALTLSATSPNYVRLSKSLLALGADVNQRSMDGSLPLPEALFHGNLPAAKLFLERGARVIDSSYAHGSALNLIEDNRRAEDEDSGWDSDDTIYQMVATARKNEERVGDSVVQETQPKGSTK